MNHSLPRLLISSGEPAGIGPELCIMLAEQAWPAAVAAVGDPALLRARNDAIGSNVIIKVIESDALATLPAHQPGTLLVLPVALKSPSRAGVLDKANAAYVLEILRLCERHCTDGSVDAMVTAPLHKGIINDAGIAFSGHTEFLAELTHTPKPVMLLCSDDLRVALATTHLPLKDVSGALTMELIDQVLRVLHQGLIDRFGIPSPRISVCGLNPHAGESGHLGKEEIDIIEPALDRLREQTGWNIRGPLPADTIFTQHQLKHCDAVLAMYHDQGLPVLKYAGFGNAVNITLGLPIIRTSVDHGTALDLAGDGTCDAGSMAAAVRLAIDAVAIR